MKARRIIGGTWICACIFCACGGGQKQSTNNEGSKKELERIENFSVDVTEDYAQIYENSSCRAVSAKINGADCMLAYSDKLHCIDVIDLTNKRPLKQIQLVKEGPHGVVGVEGIFFYDNTFVLKGSVYLYRVNWEGHVVSKWNFNDYISGFGLRFPDQHAIFNMYTYLGFDAEEGLVALPVYKYKKENGQYPAKVVIVSCKDWRVEEVEIAYPEELKKPEWLGNLGLVQALPHGQKLIYNFPASANIYVYDRLTQETRTYTIESEYVEPFSLPEQDMSGVESGMGDTGLNKGLYMPIRYDVLHKAFWRIQAKPSERGIFERDFTVSRISPDFKLIGEYDIPDAKKKSVSCFSILFTEDTVLFPYMGGEYIGENNMAFYGLKL